MAGHPIIPGTLELFILKALSLGRLHGYGILQRIEQLSRGEFSIEQGALYPALARLEVKGFVEAEWGISETKRRAKYYELAPAGRKRLREETEEWNRTAAAMAHLLGAKASDLA